MHKMNKLTPTFDSTQHTVTNKKGNEIAIKNNEIGQKLRRNVVYVKTVEGEWTV